MLFSNHDHGTKNEKKKKTMHWKKKNAASKHRKRNEADKLRNEADKLRNEADIGHAQRIKRPANFRYWLCECTPLCL